MRTLLLILFVAYSFLFCTGHATMKESIPVAAIKNIDPA
jgi:hypothetical protein